MLSAHPRVFLSIFVGERHLGKLVFELNRTCAPKCVENFIGLLEHTRGYGYKGSVFHEVSVSNGCRGGDIVSQTGSSGISIWGAPFQSQGFILPHNKKGTISMVPESIYGFTSQFIVTHSPMPQFDGRYEVFGELVDGFGVLDVMVSINRGFDNRPIQPVIITECGIQENKTGD